MHIQRQVGVALAEAIAEHEFAGSIAAAPAVYRRRPDYGLEELGQLRVSVVPGPVGIGVPAAPRGADFFELTFGIVLAKSVSTDEEIEQLEDLNMEIMDAIRSHVFDLASSVPGIEYRDLGQASPFDGESLVERHVWLSQIEVVYTVPLDKSQG